MPGTEGRWSRGGSPTARRAPSLRHGRSGLDDPKSGTAACIGPLLDPAPPVHGVLRRRWAGIDTVLRTLEWASGLAEVPLPGSVPELQSLDDRLVRLLPILLDGHHRTKVLWRDELSHANVACV